MFPNSFKKVLHKKKHYFYHYYYYYYYYTMDHPTWPVSSSRWRLPPLLPVEAAAVRSVKWEWTRKSWVTWAAVVVVDTSYHGQFVSPPLVSIMKINENTLLEGHKVVLVPYNEEHVPRYLDQVMLLFDAFQWDAFICATFSLQLFRYLN